MTHIWLIFYSSEVPNLQRTVVNFEPLRIFIIFEEYNSF
jgi:hypothetical protein